MSTVTNIGIGRRIHGRNSRWPWGLLGMLGGFGMLAVQGVGAEVTPTFHEAVAPILQTHCAGCHRPGQPGPFSLLTFADAVKHGHEMVEVTGRGAMPPWLPASQPEGFMGERRLAPEAVALLARWVSGGMPEGDPAKAPRAREWPAEWSGGKPDLIVLPIIAGQDRVGAIVLLNNVTELRRRERELVTKDATIREIHHRVKNNLQTVSALLRLQARRIEDPGASQALNEAVRRIASIALVHETLSSSADSSVAFDDVLDRLVNHALELTPRMNELNISRGGSLGELESRLATPLALVITELIYNALEHGLESEGSKLDISIDRRDKSVVVIISDDGVGLPEGFTLAESSNLGLQIVRTLTENELRGSLVLESDDEETRAILEFPIH